MSRIKYTTEQAQAFAKKLREMPPVEKKQDLSKQALVRLLAKEITALQRRGYTLEQISESLRGEGLSITTPTLKSYLQRAKPAKKAPAKKAPVIKEPPPQITAPAEDRTSAKSALEDFDFPDKI